MWFLKNRLDRSPHEIEFAWGRETDVAVVGDWDGDGVDGVGIVRGERERYLKNRLDKSPHEVDFLYGRGGDIPFGWDFGES